MHNLVQYIILKYGILKLNSKVLPSSKGYSSQYTPYGVYRLIVNEINEGISSIIILKNVILPVLGLNLGYTVKYRPLSLGIPLGSPSGTPSGGGLYLTVSHP